MKDKSINHNIFRIQSNNFIMCGFYCIAFMEYMIAGKTFLEYTTLFSPTDYQKNCISTSKTNMVKPNASLKKIDETRIYLLEKKNIMIF